MLTVLTSAKTAPGATTSCTALALAWPRPVLLADCDPAGGDIVPGLLPGRLVPDQGLLSWAAASRGVPAVTAAGMFRENAVGLPERPHVWLLPGFMSVTQGYSFTSEVWERLASALEVCSASVGVDSLVDAGRLTSDRVPWPVLLAADAVVLTVRRSVRSIHAARTVVESLRFQLGDLAKVAVLVVGDSSDYTAGEVAAALGLPLVGTLPEDRRTAKVLTEGGAAGDATLRRAPLLKEAAKVAAELIRAVDSPAQQARKAGRS